MNATAYNPLFWASRLRNFTNCPTISASDLALFPCLYAQTPSNPSVGPTWTCPASFFCPSNQDRQPCTPGFYCPENTIEPTICPQGFACSNDTISIKVCPENKYCPFGTVTPKSCFGSTCPRGSYEAPKFLLILVIFLIAVAVYAAYHWKIKADAVRELKRKRELDQTALKNRLNEKAQLARLERTFNIEFEDLGLKLDNGVEIMKNVSGTLYAGRTCAIMGPSGAGKTTFVTLLTGKVARTSGVVKLNGKVDELSNYSKLIGYVPQEDIMIRELTVRDILMHSARTRLPKSMEYRAVKEKVNEIISFLGMAHVANSIIGNEEERGVSGGQRKRVNIGMELCAEPSVLFLDEPTSGLDSSTSFEVCQNLRQIAIQQSLTIAAVIHSPSPATFRQFDDLLLLGKGGRIVYFGPREGALGYFNCIGFTCPPEESPSDYFMDVASGVVPSEYDAAFKPNDLFGLWEERARVKDMFASKRRMTPDEAILAAREFHRIQDAQKGDNDTLGGDVAASAKKNVGERVMSYLVSEIKDIGYEGFAYLKDVGGELGGFIKQTFRDITFQKDPVRDLQPMYMQLWFLMKRAFKQVYRGFSATATDIAMNFLVGTFISIIIQSFTFVGGAPREACLYAPSFVYFQCTNPQDQLRVASMFICLGSMFAAISIAGNTFGREKVVYWRDTSAGMAVLPYYLSKFLIDFPRVTLGATAYFIALIMFFPYAQSWTSLYSVCLMMHFYSFAVGYAVSNTVPYPKFALYGIFTALMWSMVLAGVTPSIDKVAKYPQSIKWIWDVSTPRWMVEAFYVQEVQALPFKEKNRLSNIAGGLNGFFLDNYSLDYSNSIKITIVWHVVAILALKLFNRSKQK